MSEVPLYGQSYEHRITLGAVPQKRVRTLLQSGDQGLLILQLFVLLPHRHFKHSNRIFLLDAGAAEPCDLSALRLELAAQPFNLPEQHANIVADLVVRVRVSDTQV